MLAELATATLVWVTAAGCEDISCPSELVPRGNSCVCPEGKVFDAQSKTCQASADAPVTGVSDGDGAVPGPPSPPSPGGTGGIPMGPSAPGTVPDGGPAVPPNVTDAGPMMPAEPSDSARPPTEPGSGPPTPMSTDFCDDGNENPFDACANHKKATCGDGFVRVGHEDCEVGVSGATEQNCRDCRRTRWLQCDLGTECTEGRAVIGDMPVGDACVNNVCTPYACPSGAPPDCNIKCPELPGRLIEMRATWCMLTCGVYHPCPVGLKCDAKMQICVGASFDSEAVIEPNQEPL